MYDLPHSGALARLSRLRGDRPAFRACHVSPPGAWCRASHTPENPRKMSLVGQPAVERNLAKGGIAVQHAIFRKLHSTFDDIIVRRNAEGHFEGSREVAGAELGYLRKFVERNWVRNALLNVILHTIDLPGSEAARGIALPFHWLDRDRKRLQQARSLFHQIDSDRLILFDAADRTKKKGGHLLRSFRRNILKSDEGRVMGENGGSSGHRVSPT